MSKKLLIIIFIVILYGCNNKQQSNYTQANKENILQINKSSNIKKDKLQQVLESAKKHFDIGAMSLSVIFINDKRPINIVVGNTSINSNKSITSKNLFQVGSITKTFTAKLITDAVDRKQLSLNETVGEILPQYKKWKKITIAQLLNQTAGISDYIESKNWWERLAKDPNKEWSLEELLAIAQKNPDSFPPGHGWAYSNSNYVLLGLILEKVTGQKLQLLFSSLINQYDLKQTYFLTHRYPKLIMDDMVQGYFENKENMTSINGSWLQGAGALVSTPEDIVRWIKLNLEANSLLQNNSNWRTTKDGDIPKNMSQTAYSLGFFRMNTPYGIVFFTPGLTPGYTSMMFYAPCLDAYFAYSVNKAPPQGLHKFMIQNLMKVFKKDKKYQQELQQHHLIPSYCQYVHPSKYFTFPKIG